MEFQAIAPFFRIAKIRTHQGYAGTDREDVQGIEAGENSDDLAWDLAVDAGDGVPMVCADCGADESDDCDCEADFVEDDNHGIEGSFYVLDINDLDEFFRDIMDMLEARKLVEIEKSTLIIASRETFLQTFGYVESSTIWTDILNEWHNRFDKIVDTKGNVLAHSPLKERIIRVARTIVTLEKVQPMTDCEYNNIRRDGDIMEYTTKLEDISDKENWILTRENVL